MNDLIWAGIWAMILKNAVDIAQMAGLALAYLIFALMCFDWAAKFYDKIKRESDLEPLLDTPQRREDTKMEGLTTFDFPEPEDEGPLTKMCPTCGERYPENRGLCIYDKDTLLSYKPITEPLPTLTTAQLDMLIEDIDEAEQQFEDELEKVRTVLEDKAYEYSNHRRPYTFTEQETLSIYNLYTRVRMQSQEEKRAS